MGKDLLMARTQKHTTNNVVLSSNEKVFVMKNLIKEAEEHKDDLDFVSALEELQEYGKNKGIIYTPSEGEKLVFDEYEDMVLIIRTSEWEGKTIHQLNTLITVIGTDGKEREEEFGVAVFRRKPALDEHIKSLKGTSLNNQMLANFIGDLKRLQMLAGKTILIKKEERWPRQEFAKGKDGRMRAVDVSKLPEEARRPQSFYRIEDVTPKK